LLFTAAAAVAKAQLVMDLAALVVARVTYERDSNYV
jgi:hypothetical protein